MAVKTKRYPMPTYVFVYHPSMKHDIAALPEAIKQKIKSFIWLKLSLFPTRCSIPLRPSLKGQRKVRIGDYLLTFRIQNRAILITTIQHYSAMR